MKSTDGVELTAEFFLGKLKSSREEIQKKGLDLNEELRKVPSNKVINTILKVSKKFLYSYL